MDKALTRRNFLRLAGSGLTGAAIYGVAAPGASMQETRNESKRTGCSVPAATPKRQFRGVWIATVENIDWPSQPGLSVDEQKREFVRLMDVAASLNLNAVVVQVRPAADAFYPSRYAPWSEYLTGRQGKDPGYDPLAFMLREAHKRNLEFHAWFNPYRISLHDNMNALAPDSPARKHPDWVVKYGGALYFDPGIPGVRRLIEESVLEVIRKYNVDAVHFDDYFYPYPISGESFPDDGTYRKYGGSFHNKADWRRHNVNQLIREMSHEIKRARPYAKFGVSPFGIWRNKSTDPTGSDTNGLECYDDLYADTRTWIRNNWLDYIAPQIYWNIGYKPAAYNVLVPWWSHEVRGSNVHLYIGQAAYKIGNDNAAWNDPDEMPSHLRFNRRYPEVKGDIYFSMTSIMSNPLGFRDRLKNRLYRYVALVPVMRWLGGGAPRKPGIQGAKRTSQGVRLEWQAAKSGKAPIYYLIYRFDGRRSRAACDFEDPKHILAAVRTDGKRENTQSFTDKSADSGHSYTYYVTALDRLHHESRPSNKSTV